MKSNSDINIIEVTSTNVDQFGIYCIRDKNAPGYKSKVMWFKNRLNSRLRIKIATNQQEKQLGFIEYIPSELAWRPVKASNYIFIQCIALFVKNVRGKNIATMLLKECESDAISQQKSGICTMTSAGPWIANKSLFEKNGYAVADKLERFELMFKKLNDRNPAPGFNDWTKQRSKYKGWHLVYASQCPWHEKSVTDIANSAKENGIELKVTKLTNPKQAQKAPSGFGTYSLIKDGELLGDHYLSQTRFQNILNEIKRKNFKNHEQ